MLIDSGQAFTFPSIPTEIHFGFGTLRGIPDRVKAAGGSRVLIVTDAGLRRAGIVDQIESLFAAAGIPHATFDGVKPDSGTRLIESAGSLLRESGADAVIGVGGGSSLDTAKAVAVLATNRGPVSQYLGLNRVEKRPLPVIAVPTTAGTGSEVTLWSVFTDDDSGLKVAIGSGLMYPAIAVCDPELTMGLSPCLTASTGMDALGHAIECFSNDACQPLSAALARAAIEMIARHLRTAVLNGRDRNSRYAMLLASTMAGIAMNPTRLGLAHALAMPLGSWDLHIPHGVAIAVSLPCVMEFNHVARPERFAEIAAAMGEDVRALPPLEAAARSYAAVRRLAYDIGLPRGLAEAGLTAEHVDRVVDEAMKSGNVVVNPRRTGREDMRNVLLNAMGRS
jgi:alcohol dehydrogenase